MSTYLWFCLQFCRSTSLFKDILRLLNSVLNSKQKHALSLNLLWICKFSVAVLFDETRGFCFGFLQRKPLQKFKVFCMHYLLKTKRKPAKKKKQCLSSKTKSACQNSTTCEHFQKWPKNQGIVLAPSLPLPNSRRVPSSHCRRHKVWSANPSTMSEKIVLFVAVEVYNRNDPVQDPGQTVVATMSSSLAFTAEKSGITNIPTAILKGMFSKAANLIAATGNVIPKPGATNGSFVVAGGCNNLDIVTPCRGGSLTCDCSCVNHSTGLCVWPYPCCGPGHRAVGRISSLVQAFEKGSKGGRNGPEWRSKECREKPNTHKRANARSQPVLKNIDFLVHSALNRRKKLLPYFQTRALQWQFSQGR